MSYKPLTVTFDPQGNATIQMPSRAGLLEMFLPLSQYRVSPESAVKAVIASLNEGISYLEQDALLRSGGGSTHVH